RRARQAPCARVRAVHVGRTRTRRGCPADVYVEYNGHAYRGGGRPVVGYRNARAIATTGAGAAPGNVGEIQKNPQGPVFRGRPFLTSPDARHSLYENFRLR